MSEIFGDWPNCLLTPTLKILIAIPPEFPRLSWIYFLDKLSAVRSYYNPT